MNYSSVSGKNWIFKKYNYDFYDYELNKVSLLKNIEYIVANNDNILQIKSDI